MTYLRRRLGVRGLLALILFALPIPQLVNSQSAEAERDVTVGIRFPGTVLQLQAPYSLIEVLPHITLGNKVQAIGVRLTAHITLPEVLILKNIYFLFQFDYFYSFNNLGIPGGFHTGFISGLLGVSVGELGSLQNNFIPLGKRNHNVLFQYEYFIDSINTSQALATIAYYYSRPRWLIGVQAENDAFAFLRQDKFRTSAVAIVALFKTGEHVWGLGLGNVIWGGTTRGIYRGLASWSRGETINIRNNYGGEYSNGILYLAGYYDSFKLSVGVDAEEIRTFFQNGTHFLINNPAVAVNPEIKPSFYIQLEINPRYALF